MRHIYIRPRSPQLNGKVERSHRIDQEEFYQILTYADLLFFEFSWIFLNIEKSMMVENIEFSYNALLTGPAVGIGFLF